MLDQQILRNNLEALKSNLERRGLDIDIDFLIQQDEKRRSIKFEAEQARSDPVSYTHLTLPTILRV